MAKTFDQTTLNIIKQQVINDADKLIGKVLNSLTNLWVETHNEDECIAKVKMISEKVQFFFDQILAEGNAEHNQLKERVSQLYTEACGLKQLLKSDINLNLDISIYEKQNYLAHHVLYMKNDLESRQSQIESFLQEQKVLCNDLGECPRQLICTPNLPTQDDLNEFRKYLDGLIEEKQNRYIEFIRLRNDIGELKSKLNTVIVDPGDSTILNQINISLSKINLLNLENVRNDLQIKYDFMRKDIDTMRDSLITMWDIYTTDTSENIKKDIIENFDYNYETLMKITQELHRLRLQIKLNIEQNINIIRSEILFWWIKTLYSESEKASFAAKFTSNLFSEDLLTAHEMELRKLKTFYKENSKLFGLIEDRRLFKYRLDQLNGKPRNLSRFEYHGGSIIRDEMEKKDFTKKVINIEREIIILAENYKILTNKDFTAYGKLVTEFLAVEAKKLNELVPRPIVKKKSLCNLIAAGRSPLMKGSNTSAKKLINSACKMRRTNVGLVNCNLRVPINSVTDSTAGQHTIKKGFPIIKRSPIPTTSRKSNEHKIANGRVVKSRVEISKIPKMSKGEEIDKRAAVNPPYIAVPGPSNAIRRIPLKNTPSKNRGSPTGRKFPDTSSPILF